MNDTLLYLKIVNPNLNDSGLYECQISYHDDKEKKLKTKFCVTQTCRQKKRHM